jgi:hypothetical protein
VRERLADAVDDDGSSSESGSGLARFFPFVSGVGSLMVKGALTTRRALQTR